MNYHVLQIICIVLVFVLLIAWFVGVWISDIKAAKKWEATVKECDDNIEWIEWQLAHGVYLAPLRAHPLKLRRTE